MNSNRSGLRIKLERISRLNGQVIVKSSKRDNNNYLNPIKYKKLTAASPTQ
jgi:hypothetical protein